MLSLDVSRQVGAPSVDDDSEKKFDSDTAVIHEGYLCELSSASECRVNNIKVG